MARFTEQTNNERYLLNLACLHPTRIRYKNKFFCENCNKFIQEGSLEYFMCQERRNLWMAVHNKICKIKKKEIKVPKKLLEIFEDIRDELEDDFIENLNEKQAQELMEEIYSKFKLLNIEKTEALLGLPMKSIQIWI
jgi:hypothetical protein